MSSELLSEQEIMNRVFDETNEAINTTGTNTPSSKTRSMEEIFNSIYDDVDIALKIN